jgi:hypothetical protein
VTEEVYRPANMHPDGQEAAMVVAATSDEVQQTQQVEQA